MFIFFTPNLKPGFPIYLHKQQSYTLPHIVLQAITHASNQPVSTIMTTLNNLRRAVRTVYFAFFFGRQPNQCPVLIETEKPMITGALEVAVVGRAFLIAVGRADQTVHIKDDVLG
jgi:chitinase